MLVPLLSVTLKIYSKASLGLSPIVTTSVKPPEKTVQFCFRYENSENRWEPNKLLAGEVREPDERGRCLQFLAAAKVLQRRKPNSYFCCQQPENKKHKHSLPALRGVSNL